MTAIIKNTTPEKERDFIIEQEKTKNAESIRKHFGSLKKQLDSVEYQKQLRNEWN